MNQIRQDEEKGYRQRKARNGYTWLGVNEQGKAIYEKGGTIYREEDHRYLVETEDEEIFHYDGSEKGVSHV